MAPVGIGLLQLGIHQPEGLLARALAARGALHRQDGIAEIVDVFCMIAGTSDSREGVAAFVEKRPPAWSRKPG